MRVYCLILCLILVSVGACCRKHDVVETAVLNGLALDSSTIVQDGSLHVDLKFSWVNEYAPWKLRVVEPIIVTFIDAKGVDLGKSSLFHVQLGQDFVFRNVNSVDVDFVVVPPLGAASGVASFGASGLECPISWR